MSQKRLDSSEDNGLGVTKRLLIVISFIPYGNHCNAFYHIQFYLSSWDIRKNGVVLQAISDPLNEGIPSSIESILPQMPYKVYPRKISPHLRLLRSMQTVLSTKANSAKVLWLWRSQLPGSWPSSVYFEKPYAPAFWRQSRCLHNFS